ncbi:hypothetical protein HF520_05105 [Romboutsia sp. CE17]|uniref:hypothetical protein n=1 Tax=Romboutsia sp. CE17 TaxID=2724150 RepID=UPI001442CC53|nr:hypothetical protein [Romboutsia sp. CE17]QJA08362.1 hypothetical protein HF520_05105 [Romboutsia sp. CE17]
MTLDKHKREDNKTKFNRNDKKNPNFKLEQGEELNLPPRLRPSKTGSVSQNTARPISSHKKHQNH